MSATSTTSAPAPTAAAPAPAAAPAAPAPAASTTTAPPRFSYFPGCSADSTGISFTLSTHYVTSLIGIELIEIPDWCCCGTSAAQVTDSELALALSARSLALSEAANPGLDVVAPCAGCYNALKRAIHFSRTDEGNRARIEELIEMPYAARADAYSLLEVMARPEIRALLEQHITGSLGGLKVASYYGCALVRPPAICHFDDVENPQSMDELMALAGGEPVFWAFKTECCGASHQISAPAASRSLIEGIFANAVANGAEAIVCACPLCMLNLDLREAEINTARQRRGQKPFDVPVYYFTELLGFVMGGTVRALGIDRHFWPALKLCAPKPSPAPTSAPATPAASAPAPTPASTSAEELAS
ncbi:MAG: CoB--CoM heterodisulfide reductase iron-sulfur subunit B family protein [Coriobacteriales bacterium]|jgi:heterodisulfide reductase subunit B|nr:CoB--CoM heterodisulfide reductase iron-sulfur subunit B family protein [Coriobacteriales bacterium]